MGPKLVDVGKKVTAASHQQLRGVHALLQRPRNGVRDVHRDKRVDVAILGRPKPKGATRVLLMITKGNGAGKEIRNDHHGGI